MKRKGLTRFLREKDGSVAVISALVMLVVVGFASLAIDLGRLYTVRNELQNMADAAALAAAGNLIQDSGGTAIRNADVARNSAIAVAQRQSQLLGLPVLTDAERTDVSIIFGVWNINAGSPATAWDPIGTTCSSGSNANAVQTTLRRGSGLAYGPVTNLFAGLLGVSTSQISATATAYLGYTYSLPVGAGKVPLAIPESIITAAQPQEKSSWWARLLGPTPAIASGPHTVTFKDLGSGTFYQSNLGKPQFDLAKAYLFIVNSSDSVPSTVVNNLKNNYTSGTATRAMGRGSRLYPLSEYQWASNIKDIFSAFQSAYNAKKNPTTGKWRVCVPVYKDSIPVVQRFQEKLWHLAQLFPFGVKDAHACFNFWIQTYPGGNVPIYVQGFANVDITAVNYVSTCDPCSPYAPAASNQVSYLSTTDCMVNNPNSCRNVNSVTIEVPVDSSTVSPGGSISGGPSNQAMNPGAPGNTGALASIPRLVQ